ncbi:DUF4129 domain-containing protein [Mycobacterium sp. NPDC048908]|uniref:DUF4129 domain-containing protein n=1 Tax=Mycobacterium sp. NPDC048908 TaxID=3364292 RepID=UPI0037184D43
MAVMEKSTARVVAVLTLLFVTAWALRGYLPGDEPATDRQRPPGSPAALIVDVALLCVSVGIIGFAIVARLRAGEARRPGPAALPLSRGTMGRPTWRFSLIALAVIIAWLLLVMTLTQLSPGEHADQAPAGTPTAADPGIPAPTPNPPLPQPDSPDSGGPGVIGYLVPPMVILMVLIVVGTVIVSRRQRHPTASWGAAETVPDGAASPGAAESLARAAEVGLAEIGDLSREPREAIIACYAAMERELTHVPGAAPLDCDTPSEVLARAVGRHALNADSATRLVELFEEARFSPHVMNESHRDDAVDALRLVLADLRSMA